MLRLLLMTVVFMAIVISAFSQYDRYFEYHNPKSKKLNSKSLKRLVGKTWYGKKWEHIRRKDTTQWMNNFVLILDSAGTYSSGRSNGTWTIASEHYLLFEPIASSHLQGFKENDLEGIFSITHLTDTTLTLEKLFTSSRDMKNRYFFGTKAGHGRINPIIVSYNQTYLPESLTPHEIDSISMLSVEQIFVGNRQVSSDGCIEIELKGKVIKIPWCRDEKRVRIFAAGEYPGRGPWDGMSRFTPDSTDIRRADALFLRNVELRDPQVFPFEKYYRQYIGFVRANGVRVLAMNIWCGYDSKWNSQIVVISSDFCAHVFAEIDPDTGQFKLVNSH